MVLEFKMIYIQEQKQWDLSSIFFFFSLYGSEEQSLQFKKKVFHQSWP